MKEFIDKLISELKQESIIVDDDAGHRAVEIIEELAEEYNNGWIPCSERLPENDCEYLVTLRDGEVTVAKYEQEENVWVDIIEEYFEYPCIAWKLLPQPYKEEGGENE